MAEVLGPVETLREAAAILRKWAEDTTAGPWLTVVDPKDDGFPLTAIGVQSSGEGFVFEDHDTMRADADWIALMDPGVAEPLADWLDREADGHEINESTCLAEALRVARVLLGVPDATP